MKNKGFTLAELLAVIVILGLIAVITIPAVTKTLGDTKSNLCEDQLKNIREAARLYGSDHLLDLPSNDGDTINITLKTLQDGGYIDENLENPKNAETISEDLIIKITKQGKKYVYDVQDFCDSTNSDEGVIATPTTPEGTKYKAYKTGKINEVSIIYFNPVENRACTIEEYNTDLKNNVPFYEELPKATEQKTGCMKWYAVENSDGNKETVDVLLDHDAVYSTYLSRINSDLNSLVKNSKWKVTPRLISAEEVAKIVGNTTFSGTTPTKEEAIKQTVTYGSAYAWLYDNANPWYGTYYTSTIAYPDDYCDNYWWLVSDSGSLSIIEGWNSDPALRPVITIHKEVLN